MPKKKCDQCGGTLDCRQADLGDGVPTLVRACCERDRSVRIGQTADYILAEVEDFCKNHDCSWTGQMRVLPGEIWILCRAGDFADWINISTEDALSPSQMHRRLLEERIK